MTDSILLIKFILVFLLTMMTDLPITDFSEILPRQIDKYVLATDTVYNSSNLHEYINGGSELYISFGFNQVLSTEYISETEPGIYLDIFDMQTSQNAYGVFSHSREKIENDFGQGSQYINGSLTFWKDRFYISILNSPETETGKKVMYQLAGIIDRHIQNKGDLPYLLTLLPENELINESVKYFYHHIWLNSHYFISSDNIFHLNRDTRSILAKYGDKKNHKLLLMVQYFDNRQAEQARDSFIKYYLDNITEQNPIMLDDNKWVGWYQEGKFLCIVFDADTRESCFGLLKSLQNNIQNFQAEN